MLRHLAAVAVGGRPAHGDIVVVMVVVTLKELLMWFRGKCFLQLLLGLEVLP